MQSLESKIGPPAEKDVNGINHELAKNDVFVDLLAIQAKLQGQDKDLNDPTTMKWVGFDSC